MIGSLMNFISNKIKYYLIRKNKFQPMPASFGLVPELTKRIKDKRLRYKAYQERSTEALNDFKNKVDSYFDKDHFQQNLLRLIIKDPNMELNKKNFDAIIIGSGIGGLVTASQLAAKGAQVLVLEKYIVLYESGGSFKRKGYTFDVGSMIGFTKKVIPIY